MLLLARTRTDEPISFAHFTAACCYYSATYARRHVSCGNVSRASLMRFQVALQTLRSIDIDWSIAFIKTTALESAYVNTGRNSKL